MLRIYRRHKENCPARKKGRAWTKCSCPIHTDGDLAGERYRASLKVRDWQKAIKKIAKLEAGERAPKLISQAFTEWHTQLHIADSTAKRYRRVTAAFERSCSAQKLTHLAEVDNEAVDGFRAGRKNARTTAQRELWVLRQFFTFALERKWIDTNPTKGMRVPKPLPSPVEPYTAEQMDAMLRACNVIGQDAYERLRARALVLLLRHTALRISDAAKLSKAAISWDAEAEGWQIRLHTRKTQGLVFLPIPDALKVALDALPYPVGSDNKPRDTGHYFWNGETKTEAMRAVVWKLLKSVFRVAKVPNAKPHRFRHTLATDILTSGGSEQDVADILGITANIVRKHYAKWTIGRQKRIAGVLRAVQNGAKLAQPAAKHAIM